MEVTNRFKRLDLVDRLPEELWAEACNIVLEAVTKTISKKKKCKKTKCLSEEDLRKQKRSERQRRKGKIHPTECRVLENSKEGYDSLLKLKMQRNRGKQWNGKD